MKSTPLILSKEIMSTVCSYPEILWESEFSGGKLTNLEEEISRHPIIQGVVWALQLLLDGFTVEIRTPFPPPGEKAEWKDLKNLHFLSTDNNTF